MRVGDCEREVAFAGAEPWKIRQSHNQSTGIPRSRESQVAEHGGRIGARYNRFAGGVAEHLITPAATEAEWLRRPGPWCHRSRQPRARADRVGVRVWGENGHAIKLPSTR